MNLSDYQNHLVSQVQIAKMPSIKDPVREEIQRCIGIYDFTATFEEDVGTIETLNIPGVVAFICTLRKDSKIVGIGRGSAIINRLNRFVERGVHMAFNSSLINAIIIATKALDSFYPNSNSKSIDVALPDAYKVSDAYGLQTITEKQKNYLFELIRGKVELSHWESKIDGLSKGEASEAIQTLKR